MSAQDVQTLRDGYAAFGRQDIPAVLAIFHEDIEWTTPDSTPIGGRFVGHEAVVGFFSRLPELYQELSVEPERFVDGGDTIVVLGTSRSTGPGGTGDIPFAHVWQMRDGKAASFQEYEDTARANQIAGAPALAAT
jgi:ketosteroid isomerase-like protein